MYVEEIMALIKLSDGPDPVVAKLARTILTLVENLREAELRAGLAEASLEAERAANAPADPVLETPLAAPVREHEDAA